MLISSTKIMDSSRVSQTENLSNQSKERKKLKKLQKKPTKRKRVMLKKNLIVMRVKRKK